MRGLFSILLVTGLLGTAVCWADEEASLESRVAKKTADSHQVAVATSKAKKKQAAKDTAEEKGQKANAKKTSGHGKGKPVAPPQKTKKPVKPKPGQH